MNKIKTDEKLNKKDKNSNGSIVYSTKIFDSNNDKKPTLILKELELNNKKTTEKAKRLLALILKYELNGKEQNVVMATSEQFVDRTEKSRVIIKFLEDQFRENFEEKDGFESVDKLYQYLTKERIPFKLTLEGTNLISYKDSEEKTFQKTMADNGEGKLEMFFAEEDIEKMKKEQSKELVNYLKEKDQERKWIARREKILKQLDKTSKSSKESFIKGEKITQFITESSKNPEIKRDLVGDFLIEKLEKSDSNSDLAKLTNEYVQLNEKGFAINVKVVLEAQRDRCYNAIQKEQSGENIDQEKIGKYLRLLDRINEYLNLFELVKVRRNWNAIFMYKAKNLNLEDVKQLCEAYDGNDKEILQYLDFKEATLQDEKLNKPGKENSYRDSESIQNLYKFLSKSNVRDYTSPDVLYSAKNIVSDRGEYISEKVYDHIVKELIEYNASDIYAYNRYAERSDGVKTYQVDREVVANGPKRTISDVVKNVSKEITKERSKEEPKNQTSKNVQENPTVSKVPEVPEDPEDPADSER